MLLAHGHEAAVGRVKRHGVDAMAETVTGLQHRGMCLGLEAQRHQPATSQLTVPGQPPCAPVATLACHPILQGLIAAVEVDGFERRGLVECLMGGMAIGIPVCCRVFMAARRVSLAWGQLGLMSLPSQLENPLRLRLAT